VRSQRGQVFRAPSGSWAFRYYDAAGQRHQRNGFRTRGEAGAALDEALRRVRLGPLFKPRMTLRELDAAYLEQYDAAPASVKWLKYNLGKGGEAVRRRADPGAERSPDRAVAGVAAGAAAPSGASGAAAGA
jgi:hypothetical protein